MKLGNSTCKLAALLPLFFVAGSASAAFNGAIYTTRGDGTRVNQNLYANKADVYLNGGPQHPAGPGLPDGTYYYQVTNPNGSVLLSTDDAVCRQLMVVGGHIMGYFDAGGTIACHHANGTFNPANGSMPVQLIPFDDTPNNGGEYKVWLIRQLDDDGMTVLATVDMDGKHITFSQSKTDNFKVGNNIPPGGCAANCPNDVTLCNDQGKCNRTLTEAQLGAPTPGGAGCTITAVSRDPSGLTFDVGTTIVTWSITLSDGTQTQCTQFVTINDCEAPSITCPANKTGCLTTLGPPAYGIVDAGTATATDNCTPDAQISITYLVTFPGGGTQTTIPTQFPLGVTSIMATAMDAAGNHSNCTWTVTVTDLTITAHKFFDRNGNGLDDDGQAVQNIKITLTGTDSLGNVVPAVTIYTNASGNSIFGGLPLGNYTVTETFPSGNWVATTNPVVNVALTTCHDATVSFGNYCVAAPSGGFTLGFWSNKNGKAILQANDPAWRNKLNLLCLRRGDGTNYDVPGTAFSTAYGNFRTWILSATAVNMAYMLSAQLAANTLDGCYQGLGDCTNVILTPALAACYGAPIANLGAVRAEADAQLCANPVTTVGNPNRARQECLKDILDAVNNNWLNFVPCAPCPVTLPY